MGGFRFREVLMLLNRLAGFFVVSDKEIYQPNVRSQGVLYLSPDMGSFCLGK